MANQSIALLQDQRQIQMLAPQLRQSLELLQLPVLELRAMIQKELQQNPTLEEKAPDAPTIEIEPGVILSDWSRKITLRHCDLVVEENEKGYPELIISGQSGAGDSGDMPS